jgi:DNA topoisomerase-1
MAEMGTVAPDRVPALRYVRDDEPGIARRRCGKGFVYVGPDGKRLIDRDELERIKKLAIPPAWTRVWICTSRNGHIQATGYDVKRRKQYRYHARWRAVRDEAKFERTVLFGQALPVLRRRIRKDMAQPGLHKDKVVATVVALLDCCFARIGNERYAKDNGSFGLTTLRDKHAKVSGSTLHLRFKGKGGKEHDVLIDDPRIVHIVRRAQELPGQQLFQYLDEEGAPCAIDSGDVNDYLREVTGSEFTAKDFRTWAGTVAAAAELAANEPPAGERERERVVVAAVDTVANQLGNTRAVCRASYLHPDVIQGYLDGSLHAAWSRRTASGASSARGLRADERLALKFLKSRARAAKRGQKAA